ncbi:MAG: 6,7-dimethyl-8-ribityllumazine synthase [Pirellulales bacterium]|nr:6,7-dimethyl-8-ribityllumazine synthase [Pirellulales bacterium]
MPSKTNSKQKQPRVFLPKIEGRNNFIGVVVSKYNEAVTSKLLAGTLETLQAHHVDPENIDVVWVPGAFELPLMASRMLQAEEYNALICLGAVIRGETTHDQHINRAVSIALMNAGLLNSRPVAFGLLTCDTLEQALNRAGGSHGNKGAECALSALQMISLLDEFPLPDMPDIFNSMDDEV